jgi:processive 1,2-diacylglycerol beta-glucosyltransferase
VIRLEDSERGHDIGEITEEQLQFLIDQMEETSATDQDYYIDEATLQLLADAGGDAALLTLLRNGLAGRAGYEVRWVRSGAAPA